MNAIIFNEDTKVFHIRTEHTSYQMMIGKHDVLLHLYYGAAVGDSEVTWRIVTFDRGFAANPYDAGDDRTFSLDVLPQEYTGYGNADYRVNGLEAVHADGSDALYLKYESHRILPGKYKLEGLPAMYGTDEEAQTLEITLRDHVSGLRAHLLYGVFPKLDVITRAVRVENNGETPIKLKKAMSAQLDFPHRPLDIIHFYGRHAQERLTERIPLPHAIHSVESKRGASSHQHNPFVILCDHAADETHGDCYGVSFVYSGNFKCETEVDQVGQPRMAIGIHPYHFSWRLEPGKVFETPEVILSFSEEGLGGLSRRLHDAIRSNLIRSRYVDSPRPVLVNNWEATYFGFDEEKLYGIAKTAREIGLDLFVLDDGWFGKRDSDTTGLGDWVVNEDKIQGGLPALAERIRGLGMKFGLWVEPEMVSEDSDLYRTHPDWCLRIPGRPMNRGRFQLNLDVSRKEVRDHVMGQIFQVIDACGVEYIKWDCNRSVGNVYSAELPPERQGEIYHRYMLGVYDMMEQLVSRYPNLLFENCSGGGGRFDAGMLYYSPQIWCSDNTDAIDRLKIQYGTSFGYPISTMGAHVSVCPNHQTGRTVPFDTRAVVASAGTFGFELDLQKLSEEEKKQASAWIRTYRKIEPLVQKGDYYRLSPAAEGSRHVVWQFVSKDRSETLIAGVLLENISNPRVHLIFPKGLDEEAKYQDEGTGAVYTGAALMHAGIPLVAPMGDYQPIWHHMKKCECD